MNNESQSLVNQEFLNIRVGRDHRDWLFTILIFIEDNIEAHEGKKILRSNG